MIEVPWGHLMPRKRLVDLDYYELLGLERQASQDQVKAAFHRFAMKYHPDRAVNAGEDKGARERIYRRGTEAYRVLSHPLQRAAYDQGLIEGRLRFDGNASPARHSSRAPSTRPVAPRARPFLIEAEKAYANREYSKAHVHLQVALGHDADHPELLALLAAVEAAIKGM